MSLFRRALRATGASNDPAHFASRARRPAAEANESPRETREARSAKQKSTDENTSQNELPRSSCHFVPVSAFTELQVPGSGNAVAQIASARDGLPSQLDQPLRAARAAHSAKQKVLIKTLSQNKPPTMWRKRESAFPSLAVLSLLVCAMTGTVTAQVPSPPVITAQPANDTVTVGQTAKFSVTVTGTAPLSYHWAKNGVNITGATNASYTTPAAIEADNGALFAVTVSNSAGSVTSISAMLTVIPEGTLEQYGTSSTGVALRWTAFVPPGGGKHPAVIVLHVGAFRSGSAGPNSVSQDLAGAGFFALSTEYRLAPQHDPMDTPEHPAPSQDTVVPTDDGHYPEQTTDVQMAIRAARQDPRCDGRVYGAGGSAGAAHVLYMAATGTPGDDQFDLGVCLSGPYEFDDIAWLGAACVPSETCPQQAIENYWDFLSAQLPFCICPNCCCFSDYLPNNVHTTSLHSGFK